LPDLISNCNGGQFFRHQKFLLERQWCPLKNSIRILMLLRTEKSELQRFLLFFILIQKIVFLFPVLIFFVWNRWTLWLFNRIFLISSFCLVISFSNSYLLYLKSRKGHISYISFMMDSALLDKLACLICYLKCKVAFSFDVKGMLNPT
jgi:hypothetical protein